MIVEAKEIINEILIERFCIEKAAKLPKIKEENSDNEEEDCE